MTDARIGVIRDAMLMGYGLFMAERQICELLAAIDKIGPPMTAAESAVLAELFILAAPRLTEDELTQKPQGSDDFILDLPADAKAHDERRAL